MIVEILKSDRRLGIKKGERYEAEPYSLDCNKVMLLARITDGYDPCCNQYCHDVRIVSELGSEDD